MELRDRYGNPTRLAECAKLGGLLFVCVGASIGLAKLSLDTATADRVEACASALGDEPQVAETIPEPCRKYRDDFKTSYSVHEGEVTDKVFNLPSGGEFIDDNQPNHILIYTGAAVFGAFAGAAIIVVREMD